MKLTFALGFSLALSSAAFGLAAQPADSLRCRMLGHLDYTPEAASIWGYSADGKEYALIGLRNALSIVDVTNPSQPLELERIPGAPSVWREIKTWQHYAYTTHDLVSNPAVSPSGLLLVDMDSVGLPGLARHRYIKPAIPLAGGGFDTLKTAHTLFIDENGICYIFGADVGVGGALIFDLNPDPWNPTYLGMFDGYYLHDGVVRGDTLWGSAVWNGFFSVIDVSNKANPQQWVTHPTPNQVTHNAWFSDDNRYLFTTDEVSGAFIGAYDVSDLQNIDEVDRIKTEVDPSTVPHNVHYKDGYLITSYYTAGMQVVDAHEPDLLVEVGRYDTSPQFSGSGFNGAWGAYPYLPSGRVLISDIETGLWILEVDYRRAAYLRGRVVDSISGQPIALAQVSELSGLFAETTSFNGRFKFAHRDSLLLAVEVSAQGYITDTASVQLLNGQVIVRDFALIPEGFSTAEQRLEALSLSAANGLIDARGASLDDAVLSLFDLSGRHLGVWTLENGRARVGDGVKGLFVALIKTSEGREHRALLHMGR